MSQSDYVLNVTPEQMALLQALNGGSSEQIYEEEKPDGAKNIIFLNGEINSATVTPVIARLLELNADKTFNQDIYLIINSPGGYTDCGWALIDTMNHLRLDVNTVGLGFIASMGTLIFMSGVHRSLGPHTVSMLHKHSGCSYGNYDELVANRKSEDMQNDLIEKHIIQNSKYLAVKDLKDNLLVGTDLYLTPKEMLKHGLCDKVLSTKDRKKKITKNEPKKNKRKK